MIYTEQEKAVRKAAIEALTEFLTGQLDHTNILFKILAEDLFDTIDDGKIPHLQVTR